MRPMEQRPLGRAIWRGVGTAPRTSSSLTPQSALRDQCRKSETAYLAMPHDNHSATDRPSSPSPHILGHFATVALTHARFRPPQPASASASQRWPNRRFHQLLHCRSDGPRSIVSTGRIVRARPSPAATPPSGGSAGAAHRGGPADKHLAAREISRHPPPLLVIPAYTWQLWRSSFHRFESARSP